ncbi:hypothetical protein M427DRAFT_61851 [Gonapodya prolifera JEL478]|uniref:Uncharacterized protein n=1 Tax=Gonapodya prolifera (strain JEL478) TaxID=1344416 RepID=A0A139A1K7_GONPJ|nr:hypothetical protein M427DRAFT_61851 [Gonapodya prolifera JEL478]|eukprot:KXS10642.1 hypothetical protein M427DRAFT_61851 [Gonapodya prolifera JEL478]
MAYFIAKAICEEGKAISQGIGSQTSFDMDLVPPLPPPQQRRPLHSHRQQCLRISPLAPLTRTRSPLSSRTSSTPLLCTPILVSSPRLSARSQFSATRSRSSVARATARLTTSTARIKGSLILRL